MNTDPYPSVTLPSERDLIELFKELSFREKICKVWHGLRAPESSGDYKYARLQLLRLWSLVAALVVPTLCLAVILWAAALQPKHDFTAPVVYRKQEPIPPLKDVKPIEPPTPLKDDPRLERLIKDLPTTGPAQSERFSPRPAPQNSVKLTRSPVIFRNIIGSDIAGEIGDLLGEDIIDDTTERAVVRALRWLKHVQESDGAWRQQSGGGKGHGAAPAMTGLAVATFLSHGETPTDEEFGPAVERGIRWLVENQEANGRFRERDRHDYSHPIATYALCEAYCLTRIPMVKVAAERAVAVLVQGQNANGSWDYNCTPGQRHDLSYTGWCVQALKAAQFAGLENAGLDRAVRLSVRGVKDNAHPSGGFGYTGPQASHLTGVGVLCMQLLGAGDAVECRRGLAWLERATLDWDKPWGKSPIYYWYYVTQAKFHASREAFTPWNTMMKRELPGSQVVVTDEADDGRDIGFWEPASRGEHCQSRVYNTTLCALSLQVAYRYLAILQKPPELPPELMGVMEDEVTIVIEGVPRGA